METARGSEQLTSRRSFLRQGAAAGGATIAAGALLAAPAAAQATLAGARVRRTTDQSIARGRPVEISYDTVTFDGGGFWSSAQPTRLTIPSGLGGFYLICGGGEWDVNNTTGERAFYLKINGTTWISTAQGPASPGLNNTGIYQASIWQMNAGDYVVMQAYQDSAGPLAVKVYGNNEHPYLSIFRLG